jgi:Subtilase family
MRTSQCPQGQGQKVVLHFSKKKKHEFLIKKQDCSGCQQGQGQVMGMGDTGVDVNQCMFRDDNQPIGPTSWGADSSNHLLFDSTTHRKIRMYRQLGDGIDSEGHGTHCAGSALGSIQGGPGESPVL